MDLKNDSLDRDDIVFVMLETLKSNGTFDEFRRRCISDIDAKPTYQNWKQRIESNVNKFLNKVKYTPELNKNTVRERLRKHLLDGHETHDLEEGANRILTQVLTPRTLSIFEPKISMAVNEFLGIANEVIPNEINGLTDTNVNVRKVPNAEVDPFSLSKLDIIPNTENMENIDETSPEFEPLTSVMDNENSNDESISGMSDLVSVGSPVPFSSKETHEMNSNGFETDKNSIEKSEPTSFDKNGIINHKNDCTDIEFVNNVKILNNSEKFKTNDIKLKSKHHSTITNKNSLEKISSPHRSKDRNSSSHSSSSREQNDNKKRSNSNSNDKKINSYNKNHRDSKDKDKKNKYKKSQNSDRDKTPKRDRKDSRSDKKEKSSSLCKEPKSLNGNKSDDESNAGGSSKQKSNAHKNKSSTSDKSRSSSSNHKSSRKDNTNKNVVDKPKDKSSTSKRSNSSSHKSNTVTKKRKHSLDEPTKNSNIEEKKTKWTDFRSSFITNDEQDAANVLLSMSVISYDNRCSDMGTDICLENSPVYDKLLNIPINTTENEIEVKKNDDQTKDLQLTNVSLKKNINLPLNNLESPQLSDSINNVCENKKSNMSSLFDNVSSTNIVMTTLFNGKERLQDNSIEVITKNSEQVKVTEVTKKVDKCNDEIYLNEHVDQTISKTYTNLKVPKLKLKLNKIDSIKKTNHHENNESNIKEIESSKRLISSNMVSQHNNELLIKTSNIISTDVCVQNDDKSNCAIDTTIKDCIPISANNILHKEYENNITKVFNDKELIQTFKGFSKADAIPCENYVILKDFVKSLKKIENKDTVINDEAFKGFTSKDIKPCKYRHTVYEQLIKLKEQIDFIGFTDEETQLCVGYKYVKQNLELAKKQNIVEHQQQNITHGGNGIQSEPLNKVVTIIYENNKDDKTKNEHSESSETNKKDCPVVNNNNHDITATNHWVVAQEMKYKLLPVKVKLERLLGYRCNNTKHVPDSPKVSSAQKSTFK